MTDGHEHRVGMDVWTAIVTQRAVRRFSDRPVPDDALDLLLEAGRRAPSSKNEQPWEFIVVRERPTLERLAKVGHFAGHLAGADVAIAFLSEATEDAQAHAKDLFDLGHAVQNMMLTAVSLGIGSVHASVYEPALARSILGYPETRRCDYLVSFGYPAKAALLDRPRRKVPRRPLSELVHRERW